MVIAVLSDSHYVKKYLPQVRELVKESDIILHLGDGVLDLEEIAEGFKGEIFGVSGNCDFTSEYPNERIVEVNGIKIFMCHGHFYNVKMEYNTIFYKGQEVQADIILFGHSHFAIIENYNDIILMNPGSIYSGYAGSGRSIGFIEISEDGELKPYICKLS